MNHEPLREQWHPWRPQRKSGLCSLLCVLAGLMSCSAPPDPPLRIGINPRPGYSFAYLARDLNYFADEGLAVKLLEFGSLTDQRRAFERGQLDGFFGTPIEVLLARTRSHRPPRIVLVSDFSQGGDVIFAAPEIRDVAALKGKRIGLEPDSVNLYVLSMALAASGLTIQDVTLVPSPENELNARLAERTIDAAVTYPPYSFELLSKQTVHAVFDSKSLADGIPDFLVIDAALVAQTPARLAAFKRAYWRAVDYAAQHPAQAHALLAPYLGVEAAEIARQLSSDIRLLGASDQMALLGGLETLPRILRAAADTLRAAGEPGPPLTTGDLNSLIDRQQVAQHELP